MGLRRRVAACLLVLLTPVLAWAAPQGKVGIKFHNGEPLDAEAVKFSLERLVDPRLKLRGATPYAPISHVEAHGLEGARGRAAQGLRHGHEVREG